MLNCVHKDPSATNTNKITVKTLFDHGHNERNKLLIYDDDPRITAVMEQAQQRHDQSLKNHEEFLKQTHQKLQEQNSQLQRTSDLKKQSLYKQKHEMRGILDI